MAAPHHDSDRLGPTTDQAPEVPGYQLTRFVGHGAFGEVWVAEETLTGLRRAIKLLPKAVLASRYDPAKELAGIREYQQKSRDHPCLVQIYHVGETEDYFYYAMEAADHDAGNGDAAPEEYRPLTLARVVERDAPLSPDRALGIVADVLRGLQHLHTHGLVHRDVKPSNVLIVSGRVKLADMGLVTAADRDFTQIGTPGYMPPEASFDHGVDLYAAGKVLYELITGLHRSKFPELPDPSLFAPFTRRQRSDLRAAIRIFNKAAHPQRKQRYNTADEFLRDVAARRARRPWLRRPTVTVAPGICVLTLGAWLGWLAWPRQRVIFESCWKAPDDRAVVVQDSSGKQWVKGFAAKPHTPYLIDLDGDGLTELLVPTAAGPDTQDPTAGGKVHALIAYEGSKELVPFWPEPFSMFTKPPWRTRTTPSYCSASIDPWRDLDGRPGDELVVSAPFPGCPTRVVILNKEPQILGEFWHYGNILARTLTDLDGDGMLELICYGWCNMPEDATGREPAVQCLMLLNVGRASGLSGRWRVGEESWDTVGSLRAYGVMPLAEDRAEGDQSWRQWLLYGHDFLRSAEPGSNILQVELTNRLILTLDSYLRPIGTGVHPGTAADPSLEIPPIEKLWVRLWPPEEPAATQPVKDPPSEGE